MGLDNAKNFAKVEVSTGYDASATTVVLAASEGAKLPTAPFNATWYNSTDYQDPTDDPNVEIIRVTVKSTDTLTVTRAQEGTTAKTHNTGGKTYKMVAGLTAKVINTDILEAVYPVGSLYFNATVSTNPATLLGFGTWAAFAEGKMIVGLTALDTDFDTLEETGGAKTVTIAEANLPAHVHTVDPPSTASGVQSANHTHTYAKGGSTANSGGAYWAGDNDSPGGTNTSSIQSASHTHTVDIAQFNSGSVGSGTAMSVMNPYIVVNVWKRTA